MMPGLAVTLHQVGRRCGKRGGRQSLRSRSSAWFLTGVALSLGFISVKRMQALSVLYMTAVRRDTKGN